MKYFAFPSPSLIDLSMWKSKGEVHEASERFGAQQKHWLYKKLWWDVFRGVYGSSDGNPPPQVINTINQLTN